MPGKVTAMCIALVTTRQRFWLKSVGWSLLLLLIVGYAVVLPVCEELLHREVADKKSALERPALPHAILIRLMEIVMSGWFPFWAGCC